MYLYIIINQISQDQPSKNRKQRNHCLSSVVWYSEP